jgi:hypothetical protein
LALPCCLGCRAIFGSAAGAPPSRLSRDAREITVKDFLRDKKRHVISGEEVFVDSLATLTEEPRTHCAFSF